MAEALSLAMVIFINVMAWWKRHFFLYILAAIITITFGLWWFDQANATADNNLYFIVSVVVALMGAYNLVFAFLCIIRGRWLGNE